MTIRTLAEALSHYGREAYLLTIAKDGPHTSQVSVDLRDGRIDCEIGKSAARNIARDPNVSLFWPATEPSGYAMIVNGTAVEHHRPTGATTAQITLTKSVLHRRGPKPAASDGPCASDCRILKR